MGWNVIRQLFFVVAILLIKLPVAFGATIRVPSEQPTIQAAVDAAGQDDTVLVEAGTYSGPGFEDIVIKRKSLVMKSDSGAKNTTLEATEPGRTIFIDTNDAHVVTIEGLTISGGYKYDFQTSYDKRGGIHLSNGTLNLSDCVIEGCYNELGGGLRTATGSVCFVTNCDISYNHAGQFGGGILGWGQSIRIVHSRIYCNRSETGPGGGLMGISDTNVVIGCYVGRNRVSHIYGVDMQGAALMAGGTTVYIDSCIISQNSGSVGSAFLGAACEMRIRHNVIYNNVAVKYPAILLDQTMIPGAMSAVIDHNTFVNNYSANEGADGVAIINQPAKSAPAVPLEVKLAFQDIDTCFVDPQVAIMNNLFAFNSHAAVELSDPAMAFTITNNDVWYSVSEVLYRGLIDDQTGSNGNISADPLFCEMNDSGLTLDATSPCIGVGTDGSTIGAKGVGCDIYAGEQPRKLTLHGTDEWGPLPDSLVDSILFALATARPWDTILFKADYYVFTPNLVIDKPLYLLTDVNWGPTLQAGSYDTMFCVDLRTFCVIRDLKLFSEDYIQQSAAIRCAGGSPIVFHCAAGVSEPLNSSLGTVVRIDAGSPYISESNLGGVTKGDEITLFDSLDVVAAHNYWYYSSIDPYILDGSDGAGPGYVKYIPWLNNPPTDVQPDYEPGLPDEYTLSQNYPNPFNPSTTIEFDLPQRADVSLVVYNILGRRVATLVDAPLGAGHHTIVWDGRSDGDAELATGVYLYQLKAGRHAETRKMLLLH